MTADGAAAPRPDATTLSVALGAYGQDRAFRTRLNASGAVRFDFADIKPVNRAFAPMVRELRFDISELALVTFLQAKAYGKPLVLLPIAVATRFQEQALLCRADDATIRGPADLVGKRIGVRAYSQTTGIWLRGILADDFGVTPEDVHWVTFEAAHVAEYSDPPFTERTEAGSDMLEMLRAGALDAVIVGNEVPDGFRTVFPDPRAAGESFFAKHGFVPVNHMVVARRATLEAEPRAVASLLVAVQALLTASGRTVPFGRAALRPAIDLALRYAAGQGLLPRALEPDDVWDGLPAAILEEVAN